MRLCTTLDPAMFLVFILLSRESNDPVFVAATAAAWISLFSESISSHIPDNPACYILDNNKNYSSSGYHNIDVPVVSQHY